MPTPPRRCARCSASLSRPAASARLDLEAFNLTIDGQDLATPTDEVDDMHQILIREQQTVLHAAVHDDAAANVGDDVDTTCWIEHRHYQEEANEADT